MKEIMYSYITWINRGKEREREIQWANECKKNTHRENWKNGLRNVRVIRDSNISSVNTSVVSDVKVQCVAFQLRHSNELWPKCFLCSLLSVFVNERIFPLTIHFFSPKSMETRKNTCTSRNWCGILIVSKIKRNSHHIL